MDKKGKPTLEEINGLLTRCEEYYSGLHNTCFAEDQQYYELDFKEILKMPEEFKTEGIVLPTARDMVDTFVDHIDISNARVFVNRKATTQAGLEEATMMQKFYLGLIHRNNVEADISPWRVGAKHYALHGLTVLKTSWDADNWVDKPQRKDGESENKYAERIDKWRAESHDSIPIVIQAINPKCIYPDPSYGGRGFVFEKQKRLCFDVKKRLNLWSNPKGRQAQDDVEYVTYYDNTYRYDTMDGEPVLRVKGGVVPHNYGFIPYVLIDSGLGNQSADGDPKMRYVGILRYMFNLLVAESRDFSIADVVLKHNAWPWFTIEGDNAGQVTEVSQRFGVGTRLPKGTKVVPQTSQVPPEALNQHLYRTSDYIAAHAAPRSVRGLSETGVRSGADRRLVIAEASSRYRYSEDAFKNGTAKVLTNCARIMKNVVPGNFNVWARTPTDEFDIEIDKKKMKEPFTCYVEFAPISEEDEYRRHDDLERLLSAGVVTTRWARSRMSNVDPIAMEIEEEREKLKDDPNLQMLISQYISGKLMAAITARGEAEALAAGGPPPAEGAPGAPGQEPGRQMVPPIPNRAAPGSAGAIQNQLAKLRSQKPINQQGQGGGGNR